MKQYIKEIKTSRLALYNRIIGYIFAFLSVLSFFGLVGTIGSSELEKITILETLFRSLVFIVLFFVFVFFSTLFHNNADYLNKKYSKTCKYLEQKTKSI